jgi:hypothetical protein
MKKTVLFLISLTFTITISLTGCGYRFTNCCFRHQTLNVTFPTCLFSIHIRNKTNLAGLEDRLRFILTEELIKRGCSLKEGSDINEKEKSTVSGATNYFHIEGAVTDFKMNIVAEKSDRVALYEVIITSQFSITLPGAVISRTFSSPFITDFKSNAKIEEIIAQRDKEIDKIFHDIATEIITVLYEHL